MIKETTTLSILMLWFFFHRRGKKVALQHRPLTKNMAQSGVRSTGDQEVAGSTPAGSATFFRGDLTTKYILRSFSRFR